MNTDNANFVFMAEPTVRSIIHVGNMQIHNNKRWGWIHRKMMALCFGWRVENTEEDKQ